MTPTKEQIERVAKWVGDICGVSHANRIRRLITPVGTTTAEFDPLDDIAEEWFVVGIVAEACKAARIEFDTPEWDVVDNEWLCSTGGRFTELWGMDVQSPAHAAILALSAYLVSKEQTHE